MTYPYIDWYRRDWLIGDSVWNVQFKRQIDKWNSLGLCDPSEKVIYIKLKQTREEVFSTAVHELHHCFEDEYDFEITKRGYVIPKDHFVLDKLERAWIDFFTQNFRPLTEVVSTSSQAELSRRLTASDRQQCQRLLRKLKPLPSQVRHLLGFCLLQDFF